MTKMTWGGKGLFYLIAYSQEGKSRQELKAGTWSQELKLSSWRGTGALLIGWLSLCSAKRVASPTVGWTLQTQSSVKKIAYGPT